MDIWQVFSYGAWAVSGSLLLWIVVDMFRVGQEFDESFLMSSREGADELLEQ